MKKILSFIGESFNSKGIPKQGRTVFIIAFVVSLFFHLGSYVNFRILTDHLKNFPKISYKQPIKVKYSQKLPPKDDATNEDKKQIVETPLEKTEKPKDSKYKSFQDHQTDRETKAARITPRKPGQDAGQQGRSKRRPQEKQQRPPEEKSSTKTPKLAIGEGPGMAINQAEREKRERYRKLIPTQKELSRMLDAGYQEFLDDELIEADRIDINTTEYRYMGYFTNMRKAIELVWNYPIDAARRGMQGEVGVEFIINKDGTLSRVRVVKTSGYKVLDDAIVEALHLASPFSPLPDKLGKERLLVTGSFRYILSSFFAGSSH